VAISFCAEDERPYLRDIERLIRQKLTVVPLPEGFVAAAAALAKSRVNVPQSRDQQNGARGRDMQRDGRRQGQPQRQRRDDRPRGDQPRRDGQAPRPEAAGEPRPRRFDTPQGEQPRNYARPKRKWQPRPTGNGGGQRQGGHGGRQGGQGGNRGR